MESIAEIKDKTGFVSHMTRFDDETKTNVMNVLQYAFMVVIPIIVFKKFVSPLFPPVEETKGSLEISVEVLLQIATMFVGMFVIHRMVTFVTPYSGKNYPEVNLVVVALSFLFIVLTFETQIADKVDILTERLVVLWNGEPEKPKDEGEGKEKVRVSQPIVTTQPAPKHQNSRADYLTSHSMMTQPQQQLGGGSTGIDQLPTYGQQGGQIPPSGNQLQQPNFDQMYAEPIAANEGFVGGGGSIF